MIKYLTSTLSPLLVALNKIASVESYSPSFAGTNFATNDITSNITKLTSDELNNIPLILGEITAYPSFTFNGRNPLNEQEIEKATRLWGKIARIHEDSVANNRIDIETNFEPRLFEEGINNVVVGENYPLQNVGIQGGASSANSYSYQVKHPTLTMRVKLEGFTQQEIAKVSVDIEKAIATFDHTIGITQSEMEYHCTLHKWDTARGNILGQYHPEGIDPTNPKIMRCKMEAVIGTPTEYEGSTVRHEVAHAIQFFNTNGKGIRSLLCEGIAVFIAQNDEPTPYYVESTLNLFRSNNALKLYNKDQVLESIHARYQMGPAIIKYIQEYTPSAVRDTLECIRSEPEAECINKNFKPAFDLARFKQWLSNNVPTPREVEESPFVFVCDSNKSQYKIFACAPWLIATAEKNIANPHEMYDVIKDCFPVLSNQVPANSNTIFYSRLHKLSYDPVKGASLTEFQGTGAATMYSCPSAWSAWLFGNIHAMHNDIHNAVDCPSIQRTSQHVIESMRNACPQSDIITPGRATGHITSPSYTNKILLLQCDTVKSQCIVFDCDSLKYLSSKEDDVRAQCQLQAMNHADNESQHVDVIIVTDNNPAERFQCTGPWGEWVLNDMGKPSIDIQIATRDIPQGCRNTTSPAPEQPDNPPKIVKDDADSSGTVPIIIGTTAGLFVTMLGAILARVLYKKNLLKPGQKQTDIEQAIPKIEISNPHLDSSSNTLLGAYPLLEESVPIAGKGRARPPVPPKPKLISKLDNSSKPLLSSPLAPGMQESTVESSFPSFEKQCRGTDHLSTCASSLNGQTYCLVTPDINHADLLGVS